MSVRTVTMKRCSRCEQTKPVELFRSHPHTRDGLQSWCKDCQAEDQRQRRSTDGIVAARDRAQRDAYRAAETELRERHRTEFDALYFVERQKRGLS